MDKKNILVFPCGSEIGLEIFNSLKYSRHINLVGGSSVDDHGKFVYNNYIGNFPFINDDFFIPYLKKIIRKHKIDAIYPTMDEVIAKIKPFEKELGCKVIGSPAETNQICLSKEKTYELLHNQIQIPKIYQSINEIENFPAFIKPKIGYGSRGAYKINTIKEAEFHLEKCPDCLIMEYLSGEEYTVDCFTDRKGKLRFVGPRKRNRIKMGISVNSVPVNEKEEFEELAQIINQKMKFRGAWFFQLKKNDNNELILLEVASRLGGSSSLNRYKGINFALLSVFDAFNYDIEIIENKMNIEIDRALNTKIKINYEFEHVYVDFDDCMIINEQVNTELMAKIYEWINMNKKIYLISRHNQDIFHSLRQHKIAKEIFNEIIIIKNNEKKSNYIKHKNSIFIDDSFKERKEVANKLEIPVFAPDMISL